MTGRRPFALKMSALALNVAGVGFFLVWLGQTDFLFGHFKGPPEQILAALALCVAGLAATVAWGVTACRSLAYARPLLPELSVGKPRRGRFAVFSTVAAVLLAPLAGVAVLTGVFELPDAGKRLHRKYTARLHRYGRQAVPKLVRSTEDPDWQVRSAALRSLRKLGPDAVKALPALIEKIGKPATGAFSETETVGATMAIAAMGAAAEPAIPALSELTRGGGSAAGQEEGSLVIRQYAARALGAIGPAALPALGELLRHEHAETRSSASWGLGHMGPGAAPAAPSLVTALADEEGSVRESAAWALEKIGPQAAPALAVGLDSPTTTTREASGRLLRKIGRDAAAVLCRHVVEGDTQTRRQSIVGLAETGSLSDEAVPTLSRAIEDEDDGVREAARHALDAMGYRAVPTLRKMLSHPDAARRRSAAHALARVGPTARAATPELVVALEDEDETVRNAAERSIRALGKECMADLRHLLAKGDVRSRRSAARLLGRMGQEGRGAWIPLMLALVDGDPDVREAAGEAFRAFGADAVPYLRGWLNDKAPLVRRAAAEGLGWIGEPARESAPSLEKALSDPSPDVRKATEEAFGKIGLPLPSPLPAPRPWPTRTPVVMPTRR